MPIQLLLPEVASQIAAGEVVERPASVVKELLENALDAGATHIVLRVEGAGQRLVEVADDGAGIPAQELALAVARHATSKLSTAEDLFQIRTLGFRGEALASIGSVSRMTITSRTAGEGVGARLRIEGGQTGEVEPAGAPVGTVVRVEDLFYNVPARLKFLKKEVTEHRQIDALVTLYALAYPQVRFQLHQENRSSLQTTGKGDRREALAALYGVGPARRMLEVIAEDDPFRLSGFTSPVDLHRSNRREIHFFVNGRPVQDSALVAALIKAYHTLLMVGKYPQAILFLEIPPQAVDVNVHPAKAEVRFQNPDRIFSFVQSAVRRALLAYTPVPQLGEALRWTPPIETSAAVHNGPEWTFDSTWTTEAGKDNLALDKESRRQETGLDSPTPEVTRPPIQVPLPTDRIPLLRLIGQVASAYLVAEGPDGLYLVDQHAAHERVLFERFMGQRDGGGIPSQVLLQAAVIELPPASTRLVSEALPILGRLGFEIEPFGPGAFLVRSVPAILAGMDPAAALRVLVEDFEEDETPLQAEVEARIIARVCKRAAVKAGKSFSPEEQRALLADLEACQSPRTCPHGRPTMIHLSVDLLERQFGRKGPR